MKNKHEGGLGTLWQNTNPPKWKLISGILLSLVNTACGLMIPLALKEQIDLLGTGFSFELLSVILLLVVADIISMGISIYLLVSVGQKVVLNLRKKLWGKLLRLDVKFYDKHESGEMVSRMTNDTSVTMNLLSTEMAELFSGILSIAGAVVILFFLDVPMTLVLLSSIPIMIFIIMPISKKIYQISFEHQEKMSELSGFLAKVLGEIRLVKAYNAEGKEYDSGIKHLTDLYHNGLKRAKIEAILLPVLSTVITLMLVGIVGFGAYRVSQGFISTGELLAFILYLFQVVAPIGTIGRYITSIQSASGSTKKIFEILNQKEEAEHENSSSSFNPLLGVLEIKNLYFKYDENPILKNISLQVKPYTTTAIVGASGVGKSTLFYLLERFYTPDQGEITLDGVHYQDISLSEWRRMFSYVSQDPQIISGTIRENLLYGSENEMDEDKIIDACIQANCHDFIMNFPNGYDTELGERGINLSGGQKQRIAIARALLRDTPFLLLDEATANLDSKSEKAIQEALDGLINSRTTIVIAHRISTIENADQIVVLDKGGISGIGTHQQLLYDNSLYRSLAQKQLAVS